MGFLDRFAEFFSLEPFQARVADPFVDVPDLETQLARIQALPRPWRAPSIREALAVPAIQRAVTLIANSVGSLSVEGWREGVVMAETPQLIARPDPYQTPRDFYRDSAWQLATRGESVYWIASRDGGGRATALVIVPLAELNVEDNPRNRLFPVYTWGQRKSTRWSPPNPTGDFVHITYLREPGALRGVGPLQLAGAATSVAVEAQEWAANFYASGGVPSVNLHTQMDLTADEAAAAREQWIATPGNMPKVTSGEWELRDVPYNEQGAQMLTARDYSNGDAARLYGIPGALLEYGVPGSSLTYQNLADVWINFVRGSLSLNYLEPIEQAQTDLLPRTTVARFAVDGLQRADEETRWRIYQTAVGVIGAEEAAAMARKREGLVPGSSELAPVPFAPPAAVPASLPELRTAGGGVRCNGQHPRRRNERCNALLAEAAPFTGRCWRCGTPHVETSPAPSTDEVRMRRLEDAVAAFATREPASTTMTIAEGAIQIRNEAPPAPSVTTTFERGAVEVSSPVTVEPAVVNVTTPDVRNEITVEPTPITNTVNVEPTPVEVRNEVTVGPTPVEVRNELTVQPTPVEVRNEITTGEVNVRAEMPADMSVTITAMPEQRTRITALPPQKRRVTKRDSQGRIAEVEETEQ